MLFCFISAFLVLGQMVNANCLFSEAVGTTIPEQGQNFFTATAHCPEGKKAIAITSCEIAILPGTAQITLQRQELTGSAGSCIFGDPDLRVAANTEVSAKALCVDPSCIEN